jgi:hypothetical protein
MRILIAVLCAMLLVCPRAFGRKGVLHKYPNRRTLDPVILKYAVITFQMKGKHGREWPVFDCQGRISTAGMRIYQNRSAAAVIAEAFRGAGAASAAAKAALAAVAVTRSSSSSN